MEVLNVVSMLQQFHVFFCSHTTWLLIEQTIKPLMRYGSFVPCLSRVMWTDNNFLASPIIQRERDKKSSWYIERNLTSCLINIEITAFKDTPELFLKFVDLTVTLDDNLFGASALKNQVKPVSTCKLGKKRHSGDTVADTLSQKIFEIWFRQRAETQVDAIKSLTFLF